MKRPILILVPSIVVLLFISSTAYGLWTLPLQVSSASSTQNAAQAVIAIDDNQPIYGRPHIAWTEWDPNLNGYRTFYRVYWSPSGWSNIVSVDSDSGLILASDVPTQPSIRADLVDDLGDIAFCHQRLTWFDSEPVPGVDPHAEIVCSMDTTATWFGDERETSHHLSHVSGLQIGIKDPHIIYVGPDTSENGNIQDMFFWSQSERGDQSGNPRSNYYNYQMVCIGTTPEWGEQAAIADSSELTPEGTETNPFVAKYTGLTEDEMLFSVCDGDNKIKFAYITPLPVCGTAHEWTDDVVPGSIGSHLPSCATQQPVLTGAKPKFHVAYRQYGLRSWEYVTRSFYYDNGAWVWSNPETVAPAHQSVESRPSIVIARISNVGYRFIAYIDDRNQVCVQKKNLNNQQVTTEILTPQANHTSVFLAVDPVSRKPHLVYDEAPQGGGISRIYWRRYN